MFVSQLALGLHGRIMAPARQHVESVVLRERASVKAAQAVLATLRKHQAVTLEYVQQVSRVCWVCVCVCVCVCV